MAEKGKIAPPTAGRETFPDSPKRLVSITKQNSATTYNIYGSPQFNPQEPRLKNTPHAFVLTVTFPRHQNETSSVFSVARSEKRGWVRFKKGVGINYSTQETRRTSGYCLGLVSILVMYWQTLWLISLNPGVIKKAGPMGAYRFLNNCPLGMTDKLIMFKNSCAFTRSPVWILKQYWVWVESEIMHTEHS